MKMIKIVSEGKRKPLEVRKHQLCWTTFSTGARKPCLVKPSPSSDSRYKNLGLNVGAGVGKSFPGFLGNNDYFIVEGLEKGSVIEL